MRNRRIALPGSPRLLAAGLGALVLGIGTFAAVTATPAKDRADAPTAARANKQCGVSHICFWPRQRYEGRKRPFSEAFCCGWHWIKWDDSIPARGGRPRQFNSVKNRFGNRKVKLGFNGVIVACIEPGQEERSGKMHSFRIGRPGSDCD